MKMMKEIRSRGPIIADLEVPLTFSYYNEGIFSDVHDKVLESMKGTSDYEELIDDEFINDMTLTDYNIEWELLNHSILIIGWGVEDGVKYWICRNSYGRGWGEAGHFRIRKGANDYGIESESSAYIPELLLD